MSGVKRLADLPEQWREESREAACNGAGADSEDLGLGDYHRGVASALRQAADELDIATEATA